MTDLIKTMTGDTIDLVKFEAEYSHYRDPTASEFKGTMQHYVPKLIDPKKKDTFKKAASNAVLERTGENFND